jgi:hypothetical protein
MQNHEILDTPASLDEALLERTFNTLDGQGDFEHGPTVDESILPVTLPSAILSEALQKNIDEDRGEKLLNIVKVYRDEGAINQTLAKLRNSVPTERPGDIPYRLLTKKEEESFFGDIEEGLNNYDAFTSTQTEATGETLEIKKSYYCV